ncbi:hypothetical protein MMMB2_0763 [Mycobacterium marinum MB2]|nr:hypothetical protein MMMB2_0763 [Mycobacterium marinum MB2]EPQ79948.1 hypothetical protein MMEU_0472 [Mycobacterium marinum str. Europe]
MQCRRNGDALPPRTTHPEEHDALRPMGAEPPTAENPGKFDPKPGYTALPK